MNCFTPQKYTFHEHLLSICSIEPSKIVSAGDGWVLLNNVTLLDIIGKDTLAIYSKADTANCWVPPQKRIVSDINTSIKDVLFVNNTLYILGFDGTVYPFDTKTRKTSKPLTADTAFTAIAAGNYLYALTATAIYRYRNNTFEQIYSSPDLPQVNTVTDLGTNIYIGTANGLFLKSFKKSEPIKIDDVKVNSLTTYKNSVFAVTGNGVLKLNGDKIIKRYLEGENITCINIDSVGVMWISTSEALEGLLA